MISKATRSSPGAVTSKQPSTVSIKRSTRRNSPGCRSNWSKCRSGSSTKGLRVVVLFEGRDAAGKGGVIKRITESLNPRYLSRRRISVDRRSATRRAGTSSATSHTFRLGWGNRACFDRSWYNRAGVERRDGFLQRRMSTRSSCGRVPNSSGC